MTSSMCAVFVCERIRKLGPNKKEHEKERLVGGFFILFLSFFLSFFLMSVLRIVQPYGAYIGFSKWLPTVAGVCAVW